MRVIDFVTDKTPPYEHEWIGSEFKTTSGRTVRQCVNLFTGYRDYWFDLEKQVFLSALEAMQEGLLK